MDLYPRSDGASTGLGFPVDFVIEVSDDNTTWVPVTSRQGYARPGADAQEFAIAGRGGHYLRVTGTNLSTDPFGHYHMQLAKIEVYRATLTTGKTVDASSSYEAPPAWGHANATDGARTVTGGGSAGWSSLAGPADHKESISVDLGAPTTVHRVDLLPRGDHLDGSIGYPNAVTIETLHRRPALDHHRSRRHPQPGTTRPHLRIPRHLDPLHQGHRHRLRTRRTRQLPTPVRRNRSLVTQPAHHGARHTAPGPTRLPPPTTTPTTPGSPTDRPHTGQPPSTTLRHLVAKEAHLQQRLVQDQK
ncbi:discoidin domain-containing protein [Kutzneria sp. NPDC052558]|uniref:discoidin domain-containing protein n=1 Tax=Kutzneria sp. NPDC052558 TaxID=3364121 RepID=UPI0037C64784